MNVDRGLLRWGGGGLFLSHNGFKLLHLWPFIIFLQLQAFWIFLGSSYNFAVIHYKLLGRSKLPT